MTSITVFFAAGLLILWRVDVAKGAQVAQTEDAAIAAAKVAD